jgi:DnaJ-class molecular chaperone
MKDNYYQILGINSDSSENEIKKAYRSLSLQHHPDKNNNSKESMDKIQEINTAYETLKDSDKKKQYDYKLKYGISDDDMGLGLDEFKDINNLFSSLFKNINENNNNNNSPFNLFSGMAGIPDLGFMNMNGMPNVKVFTSSSPPNFNNFNNPFQQFISPEPIQISSEISFQQSYTGCKLKLSYDRWIIVNSRKINEQKYINVDVPPGITDNEIIIFENIGNFIDKDNIGPIEVTIHVNNDTNFDRINNDLIYKKELTFKESLCGFSFVLDHLNGKSFAINNNNDETLSLIYNGYCKKINNLGFLKDNLYGDLVIEFNVIYPNKLSPDQIKKIRDII